MVSNWVFVWTKSLMKSCDLTWLGQHLMSPFAGDGKQRRDGWRRRIERTWWIYLKLGCPMIISMGKMNEHDGCPLELKNWKSPLSKRRLQWNNFPRDRMTNLSTEQPWFSNLRCPIFSRTVDSFSFLQLSLGDPPNPGARKRKKQRSEAKCMLLKIFLGVAVSAMAPRQATKKTKSESKR